MIMTLLTQVNYIAVAVSSVVFFVLGTLWFSPALFSTIWMEELKQHGVQLQQPSGADFGIKMALTFAANVLASLAMACLVILTGSMTAVSGLYLGIIAAFGFVFTSIGSVFIWETRSVKLFLIDAGYPAIGIIMAAVILSVWH